MPLKTSMGSSRLQGLYPRHISMRSCLATNRSARPRQLDFRLAVGNDLRIPETVGRRTVGVKFINWYISKLHKAAHTDPVAALAFHRVGNLLAPPPSMMHPRIAVRVLRENLRPSRNAATESPCSLVASPD